jgi:glycosyltransferase involved in cell wall biosynthesis
VPVEDSAQQAVRSAPRGSAGRRCLMVVPAFNEEHGVGSVVRELRESLPLADVVVVDDGSSDATALVAASAGARVLRLPFNVGIGGAVQAGFMVADSDGYDVAVQVDGDGQHPPSEVRALLEALSESDADMVIGSRFLGGGEFRSTAMRRLGIRIFQGALRLATGRQITDATSGFRAVSRRGIELFARSYPHDYPEVEAVVMALRAGLDVIEVPIDMRARETGVSSITPLRSVYYMIKVLLAVGMETARRPQRVDGRA